MKIQLLARDLRAAQCTDVGSLPWYFNVGFTTLELEAAYGNMLGQVVQVSSHATWQLAHICSFLKRSKRVVHSCGFAQLRMGRPPKRLHASIAPNLTVCFPGKDSFKTSTRGLSTWFPGFSYCFQRACRRSC